MRSRDARDRASQYDHDLYRHILNTLILTFFTRVVTNIMWIIRDSEDDWPVGTARQPSPWLAPARGPRQRRL